MKVRYLLIITLITLLLASCGSDTRVDREASESPQKKIVLKIAQNSSVNHPYQSGLEKFKEVIEKETDGNVEVNIFPNGQLGNEEQEILGVKLGVIDATIISSGSLAPFVSNIEIFNLPYLFRDQEHFYRVLDGPIGVWMGKIIEARINCIFLGYSSFGTRNAWNSKKPVRIPDDFKGMKIRVTDSPILLSTFNAFGAQATNMDWNELYSALQQGVLDGGECDVVDLFVEKFYEVTKYVSFTNHFIGTAVFIFSKKKYDRYPPYVQTAILKAGRAGVMAARRTQDEFAQHALEELKKKGLEFFPVDKDLFIDKVQSVYQKYAEKVGGRKLIDQIIRQ